MKYSRAELINALIISAIAALGGAAVVFSELDDAPGGILLGILLIIGSVILGVKTAHRKRR